MRKRSSVGGVAIAAAALMLVLTVGRQGHGTALASTRTVAKSIAMDGVRFHPADITVPVNEDVEWVNKDPFPHNVTSKGGGFRSGDLGPNRQWRLRPTTRGTFEYVCTLHPGMKAVLRVR